MAARSLAWTFSHLYMKRERRYGPFLLQFTDLYIGNIFVDKGWNITCVLDLEWVCALSIENISTLYCLTGRFVNELTGDHLDEFDQIREEFMCVFKEEEDKVAADHGLSLTQIMLEMWESNGVLVWSSVRSVNALEFHIRGHIWPRFSARSRRDEQMLSEFGARILTASSREKVADYKLYTEDLKCLIDKQVNLGSNKN